MAAAAGGGAEADSATSVRAALRSFEQFHDRVPGNATVDEVQASSAGVAGWAAYDDIDLGGALGAARID